MTGELGRFGRKTKTGVASKGHARERSTELALATSVYSYLTELTAMVRLSLAVVTTPVTVPALGSLQVSL